MIPPPGPLWKGRGPTRTVGPPLPSLEIRFGDGPSASEFAKAIENSKDLVVPAIAIFEVFRKTVLLRGEAAGLEATALMMQGRVIDASATIALEAARLSIAHRLPLADSFVLATARSHDAVLWTQDRHFEGPPGVEYREKRSAWRSPLVGVRQWRDVNTGGGRHAAGAPHPATSSPASTRDFRKAPLSMARS